MVNLQKFITLRTACVSDKQVTVITKHCSPYCDPNASINVKPEGGGGGPGQMWGI